MGNTLVVKIGTSSLTNPETGQLALSRISGLIETLTQRRSQGDRVVLVSSGSVGIGCNRLKLKERPRNITGKQAVAAVGQGRLIRVYDDLFNSLEQPIAQVLLTRQDLMERTSYVNAYNTFQELFELGVIPIVNENDTVAVDELKFGDNDTLSALVANLINADWLFLLTDVDRLYSADPRSVPDAKPISLVRFDELNDLEVEVTSKGSGWGTGGMVTKLSAARIATSAGIRMVILNGKHPQAIEKILQGEHLGTHFEPQPRNETARKRWISFMLIATGKLYLDAGAVKAICQRGKSLLAAGILKVEGDFQASEVAMLCNEKGEEIARGIVNYSSQEIKQIKGMHSEQIPIILGYNSADTIIHRDNLVLTEV